MSKKILLLVFILIAKAQNIYAYNQTFTNCIIEIAKASYSQDQLPHKLELTDFLYAGIKYKIPTPLLNIAINIKNSEELKHPQKQSLLSSFKDLFGKGSKREFVKHAEDWIQLFNTYASTGPIPNSEEIAIVVHQKIEWQEATATFLNSNNLNSVPVVLLGSEHYPIQSSNLFSRSQSIQWSNYGDIQGIGEKTNKFNLFGGICTDCVSTTVASVLREKFQQQQKGESSTQIPLEFFMYTSLTYDQVFDPVSNPAVASSIIIDYQKSTLINLIGVDEITKAIPGKVNIKGPVFIQSSKGPSYRFEFKSDDPKVSSVYFYMLAK